MLGPAALGMVSIEEAGSVKGMFSSKLAGGRKDGDDRCSDIAAPYNLRYPRATACLTLSLTGSSPWTRT